MFSNLSNQNRQLLLSSLMRGEYSLVLGAGFSKSSKDAHGRELPLGDALARELAQAFDLPEKYSLGQLCSALSDDQLHSFFHGRFSGCSPSEGAALVTKFVWSGIYTFNVDDVLSRAYEQAQDPYQTPEFFTYRDAYERPTDLGVVHVVHLHGYVHAKEPSYVFSTRDYGMAHSRSDSAAM